MSSAQSISVGAKIREAGRHTVIYGLGSVAQSASGLVLLPILTGSLSQEDFGAYSLILMASSIASAVFYFGMTSALPRSYFDYESEDDRRAVFTTAFVVLIFGAVLQAVLGCAFSEEISSVLIGSPLYAEAFCYGLVGGSLSFVNAYFFAFLRLHRKSVASVTFSIVSLIGTIALTLYLLSINPGLVTAPFEAMTYTQLVVASCFVVLHGKVAFTSRILVKEVPRLMHFGVASIVASFGSLLLESLDRLIIQHFYGLAEVGVYSAAIRVSLLINVVLVLPFSQIWSPMMMEYRNKSNIGELFTYVFSVFAMLGGLIILVSSLFANEFLSLLIRSGVNSDTVIVFLLFMLGLLVFSTVNFFSAGLFYERKVHFLPFAYYGVVLIKFAIGMLLISVFGLIGAAITALLSYCALPCVIHAISKKYFNFRIEWNRLFIFSLNAAPALAYGLLFSATYELYFFARVVWLAVSICLIYFTCFSANERQSLRELCGGFLR